MLEEPVTYLRAQDYLRRRTLVPTALGSRELALEPSFPATTKARAVFSARVSSANVLGKLAGELDAIVSGETDLASARTRLKVFLAGEGFAPDDVAALPSAADERRGLANLASTRRLNLIIETNARQAAAEAQRAVDLDPDIMERWPYLEFVSRDDERVRAYHKDLHGKIIRKDDPFWLTHTPPIDYGCRCRTFNADEEDARRAGGVTQTEVTELPSGQQDATVRPPDALPFRAPPNESGYVFRQPEIAAQGAPPTFNFDAIRSDLLRPQASAEIRRRAAALQADPVETLMETIEDELVENRFETLVVTDRAGNLLVRREGGKVGEERYKVPTTVAERIGWTNGIATHNHPRGWEEAADDPQRAGNSFSPGDLVVTAQARLAEVRAVSPGWRHVMRRPEGGWPLPAAAEEMLEQIDDAVMVAQKAAVEAGTLTLAQAQANHYHLVSQQYADRIGADYRRDPR